jgi:hypothetical protein
MFVVGIAHLLISSAKMPRQNEGEVAFQSPWMTLRDRPAGWRFDLRNPSSDSLYAGDYAIGWYTFKAERRPEKVRIEFRRRNDPGGTMYSMSGTVYQQFGPAGVRSYVSIEANPCANPVNHGWAGLLFDHSLERLSFPRVGDTFKYDCAQIVQPGQCFGVYYEPSQIIYRTHRLGDLIWYDRTQIRLTRFYADSDLISRHQGFAEDGSFTYGVSNAGSSSVKNCIIRISAVKMVNGATQLVTLDSFGQDLAAGETKTFKVPYHAIFNRTRQISDVTGIQVSINPERVISEPKFDNNVVYAPFPEPKFQVKSLKIVEGPGLKIRFATRFFAQKRTLKFRTKFSGQELSTNMRVEETLGPDGQPIEGSGVIGLARQGFKKLSADELARFHVLHLSTGTTLSAYNVFFPLPVVFVPGIDPLRHLGPRSMRIGQYGGPGSLGELENGIVRRWQSIADAQHVSRVQEFDEAGLPTHYFEETPVDGINRKLRTYRQVAQRQGVTQFPTPLLHDLDLGGSGFTRNSVAFMQGGKILASQVRGFVDASYASKVNIYAHSKGCLILRGAHVQDKALSKFVSKQIMCEGPHAGTNYLLSSYDGWLGNVGNVAGIYKQFENLSPVYNWLSGDIAPKATKRLQTTPNPTLGQLNQYAIPPFSSRCQTYLIRSASSKMKCGVNVVRTPIAPTNSLYDKVLPLPFVDWWKYENINERDSDGVVPTFSQSGRTILSDGKTEKTLPAFADYEDELKGLKRKWIYQLNVGHSQINNSTQLEGVVMDIFGYKKFYTRNGV